MNKFSIHYQNSITIENLFTAWRAFVKDKKNRRDVADFQMRLTDNLIQLHRDLKNNMYVHGGYHAFKISDPKPRLIHKASVRDRIVHRLIYTMLYQYIDSRFIHDSYSSRLEKGTHRALDRFKTFAGKVSKNHNRTIWVLKCDIRKFFANINHQILKSILRRHIASTELLWLIEIVIDSFHTEGKPGVGLPLGNVTSQILVNIYMNEFDQFAKHTLKAKYYVRYADDFICMSRSRGELISLLPRVREFLRERLHLELHPDKVSIHTFASGVDFLGWVHFTDHRVLRTTTKRRMIKNLGDNPKPTMLVSYRGMLVHGNTHTLMGKHMC